MADDPTNLPDPSVRDLNQTITRLSALRGEFAKLKRELEDTGTQTIENYKKAAGEATELGRQLDRVLESRKKILSTLDAEIQALEKEAATSSTIEKRQEAQRKLVQKQLELEKEKARQYSDQADKLEEINKNQEKLNKKVKENAKQQDKITKELEKQKDETDQLKENLDAIDNSFSSALSSIKRIASGDIAGGLKGVAGDMFDIARVMAKSKEGEGGFLSKILDPVGSMAKGQMEKLSKDQASRLAKMSGDSKSVAGAASEAGKAAEAASSSVEAVGTAAEAAAPALEATGAATVATGEAAAAAAPAVAEAGAATASMGSSAAAAGVSITGATVATGGLVLVVIAVAAAIAVAIGSFVILAKEIITFNMQLYDANKLIQRTTYLSEENSKALLANANDMRAMGVATEDMVAATQALVTGFKDFTKQTPENQKALVEFTAVMNRLGMSAEATANSLVMMTKAMGFNVPQATEQLREIEFLARDLQIPFSELGQSLSDNTGFISKFGREGIEVFKDLAIASKNSQIEIGRLVAIARQFDTFEGAASTAGKLNAALGGNFLNAMEMITTTDPVERLKMIQQAILSTGLSFDEMGYYQQEMLAASAGLQDVSELALVMSGNFDLAADSVKKTSDEYITAEERARDLQGFMEKVENIFYSVLPAMENSLPVFEEIVQTFATSLQDPKTKQGIKDFANELLELAPLALEIAQSFGTLMSLMIKFADVGAFILKPFIATLEAAVGLFNSLFGSGSLMDAPGYLIQLTGASANPITAATSAVRDDLTDKAVGALTGNNMTAAPPSARQAPANVAAARKALTDARTAGNREEEIRLLNELNETLRAKELSVNMTATNDVTINTERAVSR
jgi:hypothetical protein